MLHTLLWNFMRRTVEFGGNYRDVEIGLPLGASLSPLLGALYLSPLDELAKTHLIPSTVVTWMTGSGYFRKNTTCVRL